MINRRETIAGIGAAAAAGFSSVLPVSAGTSERIFELRRKGVRMGQQSISVSVTGNGVVADIEVDIVARLLSIPVWRYSLRARELWRGGKLQKLTSKTNDDGRADFVNAEAVSGGVAIEGSRFKGTVEGLPATSTYWTRAFMDRPVWINAQHGKPKNIRPQRAGRVLFPSAYGPLECEKWNAHRLLNLEVFFDAKNECVGAQFDGAGATVSAIVTQMGGPVSALWNYA